MNLLKFIEYIHNLLFLYDIKCRFHQNFSYFDNPLIILQLYLIYCRNFSKAINYVRYFSLIYGMVSRAFRGVFQLRPYRYVGLWWNFSPYSAHTPFFLISYYSLVIIRTYHFTSSFTLDVPMCAMSCVG